MALDPEKLEPGFNSKGGSTSAVVTAFCNAVVAYLGDAECGGTPTPWENPGVLEDQLDLLKEGIQVAYTTYDTIDTFCDNLENGIRDYLEEVIPEAYPSYTFDSPCLSVGTHLVDILPERLEDIHSSDTTPYINEFCETLDDFFHDITVEFTSSPPDPGKMT